MGMGGGGGRGEVTSEINVTPMADVMLVLLIIFMVVTPMMQKGADVTMSKTRNPQDMHDADKDDAVMIGVSRDGKFYLKADRINAEDITAKVTEILADSHEKTVYVKSDARAKYGDVVTVVDNVRNAGVDKIGLMTDRIDEQVRQ